MVEAKRRWSGLFRKRVAVLVSVLLAVSVGIGTAAAVPEDAAGKTGFDFAKGNAAIEVIYPRTGPVLRQQLSTVAMDGTLILRVSAMMEGSWFDATAPYHRTAVGIHSDLGRRPAREARTNKNLNIAMLYSSYRVLNSLFPQSNAVWREMLTSVGLNPDDNSTDKSSPIGLGNLAGAAMVHDRENDGMNQLGNEGGKKYFRKPYEDYTGYRPVNSPFVLTDPSHWQPQIVTKGNGLYQIQHFVTPQIARTKPFSFTDPAQFTAPVPTASNHHNLDAYRAQADEILNASANLTDEQKLTAEFFNDKLLFAAGFRPIVDTDLFTFIQGAAAGHMAGFDSLLAAWYNKVKYDTPRPVTAIQYLYGNQNVTAWGGPGKGTVTDMPGNLWRSYLEVSDHPEYPSGSTAFCASQASVGRLVAGSDRTELVYNVAKGGSYVEPGVTPAKDTELRWTSWNKMVDDCAMSRIWGGVHFKAATEASKVIGEQIGKLAYDLVQRHIAGRR